MDKNKFNRLISLLRTDESAVEEIYGFYYKRIVNFVTFNYGKYDHEFAEDVALEFFEYLFDNLGKIGDIDKPTSWVYKVTSNLAKKRTKNEMNESSLDTCINVADCRKIFDFEKNEISEAIATLCEDEQLIVRNYIWGGYTLLEIGEMLNINYATVRKKYNRLLKKLKILLYDVTI